MPMSAKLIQETSRNFIKIFQYPYQLISKCLSNFLKMFVKLSQKHTKSGGGGQDHWKFQLKVWYTNNFFGFFFSIYAPNNSALGTLLTPLMGLNRDCFFQKFSLIQSCQKLTILYIRNFLSTSLVFVSLGQRSRSKISFHHKCTLLHHVPYTPTFSHFDFEICEQQWIFTAPIILQSLDSCNFLSKLIKEFLPDISCLQGFSITLL